MPSINSPSRKENLHHSVCIIGAPFSHGQTLDGVSQAPNILRECGLSQLIENLGWKLNDLGDLKISPKLSNIQSLTSSNLTNKPNVRAVHELYYTEEDIPKCQIIGQGCGQIAEAAANAAKVGNFVLTIGGDHSIAAGSIAGMLSIRPDLIVVWVDAHGDINIPETSPSKSYHGMPVAHLLGWFKKEVPGFEWMSSIPILKETDFSFIGLRDIDHKERQLIKNSQVTAFTMKDVDEYGISAVVRNALNRIDPQGTRPIHLSFDIDSCDPSIAPGTGTRARGGLSYREAHYICESLYDTGRLVSMDLVEINPDLDKPDEHLHGDNPLIKPNTTQTVRFGLELISSALGKAIL